MSINPVEDLFIAINNIVGGIDPRKHIELAKLISSKIKEGPEVAQFLFEQLAETTPSELGAVWRDHVARKAIR